MTPGLRPITNTILRRGSPAVRRRMSSSPARSFALNARPRPATPAAAASRSMAA
jgi:hypothetical protein